MAASVHLMVSYVQLQVSVNASVDVFSHSIGFLLLVSDYQNNVMVTIFSLLGVHVHKSCNL